MTLPTKYKWLEKESSPAILREAVSLFGTREQPGSVNSQVIMSWAADIGGNIKDVYKADSIPWCGLFVAICCKHAQLDFAPNALWALSWSAWGHPVDRPMLGDVLIFVRPGGGHVGIYVGEDATCYHVLGGNQGDSVSIARIDKKRHYATRRTPWKIAQPANVRPIILTSAGAVSTNEA